MKYTKLEKAGLHISKLGLGTNAVGGHNLYADVNEEEGKRLIEEAMGQGITFFDTADSYGFGRSEELVGEVLKGKRHKVVFATKGGIQPLLNGEVYMNNEPSYLRNAVENSLRRLQTDYIDLYYLHFTNPETSYIDSIGELTRLKEEGKIRSIGISNVNVEQLKEANQHGHLDVVQSPYNMLDRTAGQELLPYCIESGISFIPYGPLAFGILGGKYTEDFELNKGDWRQSVNLFEENTYKSNFKKVEKLKDIAKEKDLELSHVALAWLLNQKGIDTVIPGGKRAEQIRESVRAVEVSLNENVMKEIESILED
ncbi:MULTISPECIES: aldo/keto reductase [Bacillus cereus group]|uniref:aldo/keto reductase n=1 Tax=Bacillus cereus group TaxID=86661 RepID=UPI0022E35AC5|nr:MULTISPECIES: aldo/keto reductase [unclassified Bacillus cereus group]MDA2663896.1 aldo/keto reductase [Bacillus cereus group sp. Bc032]MDA2674669.1 aldo/keto reductase [Bacillus cereus group sp. Bc031]MDA2680021.1 aldo/keto reductase [Bacillus cereus group sp. Bc029]MDA2685552.1 aldo/keto reductase [Bacillus cereus group sp. Bc030]MDA2740948.1 aldo/keto reductase [Bacillus cereus group sp. Bc011]